MNLSCNRIQYRKVQTLKINIEHPILNIEFSKKISVLSYCLCGIILSACASVSQHEQFLSAGVHQALQKSDGTCTESVVTEKKTGMIAGLAPDNISIIDWNIYKGSLEGWDRDFLRLSDGKDIILLQEASLTKRMQEVLQQQNLHWILNNAFQYEEHETGVLLASAIPAISSCGQRTREPLIGIPKTILVSRYVIENSKKELLVANIHGINITLGTGSYREQFEDLERILQKHIGPLVVAGDFNNWSDERAGIIFDFAKRLSLQQLAFADEVRTTFFGDAVDHIFYRGLVPLNHMVHPVDSSDHNPISVNFRLLEVAAE